MAVTKTINGSVGRNADLYTYQLYCEEKDVNTSANTSKLKVTVRIVTGGSSGVEYAERNQSATHTVTINGTNYTFTTGQYSLVGQTTTTLGSVTSNAITHNDDGTKTVNVSASSPDLAQGGGYGPYSGSASGSVTLTAIPRYATINSFTVAKRDETSLTFSFTASATCDYAWYSTNNGSTWTGVDIADGTSGSFNVTGLSANTSYTCKLRVRRKDSQLNTDSNAVTQSTYDYPKVSTIGSNPLTIGNQQTLTLYNPLGRNVTIKMYQNNTSGTELYSGTTNSKTTYSFTPTASTLYNSIPNNQNGNCVYSVIYSNISTKTTGTATYKIRGDEYPTFDVNNWSYTANLTELTNSNQIVIDKFATVTATINTAATSNYGANIDKYVVEWGNATPTQISSGSISGTITNGSGNTLKVTVYDKRGLPKETIKTITNVPYTSVNISTISTPRTNGVEAGAKLNLVGTFYNTQFGTAGVQNSLYSAKYYVSTDGSTWSGPYPNGDALKNAITVNGNNFSVSNFDIHANGSSGGFTIGTHYYVKVEIKDAQGLLSTGIATTTVTDGKIARDVYKDSNGEYHEGINGLADSNYTQKVHGKINATEFVGNLNGNASTANTAGSASTITNIDLTGQTTTILAQVKALGTSSIKGTRIFYTTTDGGSSGISDKPTGNTNAGFACVVICNRFVSTSDYRYRLNCYVQNDIYEYVGFVDAGTSSISWTKMIKSKLSEKLETINGRITNANITHYYENGKAHLQLLHATSAMTSNKPANDGYIIHCSWDNSGEYNSQLYLPNNNTNVPVQFRGCNNGTWGSWENVYRVKNLYNNATGSTGTITLSETSANFTYIEIFFKASDRNDAVKSIRVYSPNGKKAELSSMWWQGTTYGIYCTNKDVSISGTSISANRNGWQYIGSDRYSTAENRIAILRVDGYR